MKKYLLDANIFIQAKNHHYGFDFCPAFWEWIIIEHNNNKVYSIDKVYEELKKGKDELSVWIEPNHNIFIPTPTDIIPHFQTVSDWVQSQQYHQSAIQDFFSKADYFLIAHALASDYTIVTHEASAPNKKKNIKIPDVCRGLGIKCIPSYEMLRHEKAKFVLG